MPEHKHDEEVVEGRSLIEVIKMIGAIAAAVVALGGATTYGVNTWTSFGWVTKAQFISTERNHVSRDEFESRNKAQDDQIKAGQQTQNEILAYVKIVPQIIVQIRIKCMGNDGVQPTIDDLKKQYRALTGEVYVEPSCVDPQIRGVR